MFDRKVNVHKHGQMNKMALCRVQFKKPFFDFFVFRLSLNTWEII